jgi:hypothetical protein
MTTEIYFKKVVDLTSKEIMLIYDKHQDCAYPLPIPRYDKTGIVMNLVSIEPNFLINLEKKYFFERQAVILNMNRILPARERKRKRGLTMSWTLIRLTS